MYSTRAQEQAIKVKASVQRRANLIWCRYERLTQDYETHCNYIRDRAIVDADPDLRKEYASYYAEFNFASVDALDACIAKTHCVAQNASARIERMQLAYQHKYLSW